MGDQNHTNDIILSLKAELRASKLALKDAQQRLDSEENNFTKLFEYARDGYIISKGSGELLKVNSAFVQMLGYSREELFSISWRDLTPSEWLHWEIETHGSQLIERGYTDLYEKEFIHKDGSLIPVQIQAYLLNKPDGFEDALVAGFARDLSELNAAKSHAQRGEQMLESIFQVLPDLFFLLNKEGIILDFRTGKPEDLYEPPEVFLGKKMQDIIPESVGQLFVKGMEETKKSQDLFTFEYQLDLGDYFKDFETRLCKLPNNEQYVAIIRDISEKKFAERKNIHQAYYDALTDLPNRIFAVQHLAELLSKTHSSKTHSSKTYSSKTHSSKTHSVDDRVAVLSIDLDDFKKINDIMGHQGGDQLLIQVARRLTSVIGDRGLVARLGGDEYQVFIGGISEKNNINLIIEEILQELRNPFTIDGRRVVMSASIGAAFSPNDGDNPSELMRNADMAMYQAKSKGCDSCSFFTESMNLSALRQFILEEKFYGALERGELRVVFQAIIETCSAKVIGAEALLRWRNPILGNVSPVEFIPVAERTGLISTIGKFVLNEALNTSVKWQQDYGINFKMAVNLSPYQFRTKKLAEEIEEIIIKCGANAKDLELEITEGVLLSGYSHVEETLAALHNMGVSIAMDDFGTGYSSLNYLRNYPFDVLKIDRSFIENIENNPSDRKLVSAAIAMAHSLDIKAVAEGIETPEQLSILGSLGCDYVQGYLLGCPEPADKWIERLQQLQTEQS